MSIRAATLILAIACLASERSEPRYRVLFIGNSLTAANDLPAMVERLGPAGDIETATIALPDFGLEEHWRDGRAVRAIRRRIWTHVVLQQGPSSLPESRRVLLMFAERFSKEIRAAGATPIFYSVWPPRTRWAFVDAVTDAYAAAATQHDGRLAPAGEAWRIALEADPRLELFGPDGFHPSPTGSRLAALVILQTITGEPSRVEPAGTLRDAAAAAVRGRAR